MTMGECQVRPCTDVVHPVDARVHTHSLTSAQTLTLDNSCWLRPCSKVRALRRNVRCFCERPNPSTRPQEYIGSDGRRKATIEEAFSTQSSEMSESHDSDGRTPPWGISWQTAERNLEWNDDIKHRLLKVSGIPTTQSAPTRLRMHFTNTCLVHNRCGCVACDGR